MEQGPSPEILRGNTGPISYMEYLALSEDEKTSLPSPFLTVRWWDNQEIPLLTNQYLCQLRKAEGGFNGMNTAQASNLVENLG